MVTVMSRDSDNPSWIVSHSTTEILNRAGALLFSLLMVTSMIVAGIGGEVLVESTSAADLSVNWGDESPDQISGEDGTFFGTTRVDASKQTNDLVSSTGATDIVQQDIEQRTQTDTIEFEDGTQEKELKNWYDLVEGIPRNIDGDSYDSKGSVNQLVLSSARFQIGSISPIDFDSDRIYIRFEANKRFQGGRLQPHIFPASGAAGENDVFSGVESTDTKGSGWNTYVLKVTDGDAFKDWVRGQNGISVKFTDTGFGNWDIQNVDFVGRRANPTGAFTETIGDPPVHLSNVEDAELVFDYERTATSEAIYDGSELLVVRALDGSGSLDETELWSSSRSSGSTRIDVLNQLQNRDSTRFDFLAFDSVAYEVSNLRIEWTYTPPDQDGDGIPDGEDADPDDPEDYDGYEDKDGVPDPDNDGDGVPDDEDPAPNDPDKDDDGLDDGEDPCPSDPNCDGTGEDDSADEKPKNPDNDGDGLKDGNDPAPNDPDRDNDGVEDGTDEAPDSPEDDDGYQDGDGAPDPDNDNDGIPDDEDGALNEPEDPDGVEDGDGVPENDADNDGVPDGEDPAPTNPDRDNDRVEDGADEAPDSPEDEDGYEDGDGVPDPDNDDDGVPDEEDGAPNEPEDDDGVEDGDGIPEDDADDDGVPDEEDDCPTESGSSSDGCPVSGPNAEANGPYSVDEEGSVTLDSSGSEDPDGEITDRTWTVTSGPSEIIDTDEYQAPAELSEDATATVQLTVTDNDGETDTDETTVNINEVNDLPTAQANGPYSVQEGKSVTLDSSGSSDPENEIDSREWEVVSGDGSITDGKYEAPASVDSEATAVVELTVTDVDGDTDTNTTEVTIRDTDSDNERPTADANGPYSVTEDESISLDSSGSTDSDGSIESTSWTITSGPGEVVDRTYQAPSNVDSETTATVNLTVTDSEGASDNDTAEVTISPADGPSISEFTATNLSGKTIRIQFKSSEQLADIDVTVTKGSTSVTQLTETNFSESGSDPSAYEGTYTVSDSGMYEATLTVAEDADGNDGAASQSDTVEIPDANDLPIAVATVNRTDVSSGDVVSLNASESYDPDGSDLTYAWDLDDDGEPDSTGVNITTSFDEPGEHPVTMIVTDGDGATNSTTVTITVSSDGNISISGTTDTAEPGENVTVTFTATNNRTSEVGYIVNVTDIPEGFSIVDRTDDGGTWNAGETKWLWQTVDAGASKTPSITLSIPEDANGTYAVEADILDNEAVKDSTRVEFTTCLSIPAVIDENDDNEVGDFEILTAIEHWRNNEEVPRTCGKTIGDFQILDLIEIWRNNEQISDPPSNEAPTAEANGPYSVTAGNSVSLDSTGSTDPDGPVESTSWTIVSGPGSIAGGTYEAPPDVDETVTVDVRLTVTDDDGETATDTATITVSPGENAAPVARLSNNRSTVTRGGTVKLNAGRSSDPDGDDLTYDWAVIDSPGGADPNLPSDEGGPVTLEEPGTYDFRVTVSDEHGRLDTDMARITVEEVTSDSVITDGFEDGDFSSPSWERDTEEFSISTDTSVGGQNSVKGGTQDATIENTNFNPNTLENGTTLSAWIYYTGDKPYVAWSGQNGEQVRLGMFYAGFILKTDGSNRQTCGTPQLDQWYKIEFTWSTSISNQVARYYSADGSLICTNTPQTKVNNNISKTLLVIGNGDSTTYWDEVTYTVSDASSGGSNPIDIRFESGLDKSGVMTNNRAWSQRGGSCCDDPSPGRRLFTWGENDGAKTTDTMESTDYTQAYYDDIGGNFLIQGSGGYGNFFSSFSLSGHSGTYPDAPYRPDDITLRVGGNDHESGFSGLGEFDLQDASGDALISFDFPTNDGSGPFRLNGETVESDRNNGLYQVALTNINWTAKTYDIKIYRQTKTGYESSPVFSKAGMAFASSSATNVDTVWMHAEASTHVLLDELTIGKQRVAAFSDGFEDGDSEGWSAIETPHGVNDRDGNDWDVITDNPISGSSSLRVNTNGDWSNNGIATDEHAIDMSENFTLSFDWRAGSNSRGIKLNLLEADGTNFEDVDDSGEIIYEDGIRLLMSGKQITSEDTGSFSGTTWNRPAISADETHTFTIKKRGDRATLYLDGEEQVSGTVGQTGTYRLLIQSSGYFGGSSTLVLDDVNVTK